MNIIALPDLHDSVNSLLPIGQVLSKADLVLLVGDLTNGGPPSDADRLVQIIQKLNPSILAVPGNWDRPEIDAYLSQKGINLNRRHILMNHLAFIGMGASLPGIIWTPNEITESDFERFLDGAVSGLDPTIPSILVCHQPPYNTLNDLAQGNAHVGSRAVRKFIERHQPRICFTGHIHEGAGVDKIGETLVINAGPLSQGHYSYTEVTSQGLQTLEIRPISSWRNFI